jgi:hypothetical protein
MLHRLEHSDGFAELFPSLGVFDGNLQRPLHAADQFGSQSGGSDVESLGEIRGGADFFRRSVAEFHDVKFARKVHGGHGRYFQAASLRVHNEDTVARSDDDEVGDGRVGNKEFFTGELPVCRAHMDIPGVPTRAGF